jgi:hypothetical protein
MRSSIALLVLSLCACGDGAQQPRSQDRIYDTQRQALEKAQSVDDTVMDAAQRQRAEEEAQAR